MCIIVAKPAGIKFPSLETMETCYMMNDDGAGIAYTYGGQCKIYKGFMNIDKFLSTYEKILKSNRIEIPYLFHFRIGTHGKKRNVANCHPFPVSNNYNLLIKNTIAASAVIAHNGIIGTLNFRSGYSDTMEFIANIFAPLYNRYQTLDNPIIQEILVNVLGNNNKLAILNASGTFEFFGEFIKDKGIYYSNSSYRDYYTYTPTIRSAIKKCSKFYACDNAEFDCLDCQNFDHFMGVKYYDR